MQEETSSLVMQWSRYRDPMRKIKVASAGYGDELMRRGKRCRYWAWGAAVRDSFATEIAMDENKKVFLEQPLKVSLTYNAAEACLDAI